MTAFRIAVRPYARVVGVAKAGLALLGALAAIGIIADAGTEMEKVTANEPVLAVIIVAAFVGGSLALRVMWSNLRSAVVRRPTVRIDPEGLTVDHEGVFKRSLHIERADIRVISFDDRPARRRGRDHPRFPLPVDARQEPAWLYSSSTGSPFPLLSQVPDVPNMAIVFERPLVLGAPRRFVKAFPSKQQFFPPLPRRPSRGLLLRVKDPGRAQEMLGGAFPIRPVVLEDLPEVDGPSLRRARRLSLRNDAVLGVLILGQFALPVALADGDREPPGSETFSALGEICGPSSVTSEPYEPDSESLGDLLIDSPAGMSMMFDSPIDLGDAALFAGVDVPEWTAKLLEEGYERGYARRWSAPGRIVYATVWEFDSKEGAQDFELFARDDLCPFVQDAFLVEGVAGATGFTVQNERWMLDQVVFLRGRYRFTVGIETPPGSFPDHAPVVALARDLEGGL